MKTLILFFSFLLTIFTISAISTQKVSAKRPIYYGQETIKWASNPNASYYNILYKEAGSLNWQYSIQNVPNTSSEITIGYLKMWVWYQYKVVAVDYSGNEHWSSSVKKFTPTLRTQTIR